MGNYHICEFCGNLCKQRMNGMCENCEETYRKIRSIVDDNPNTIVLEISNQTGVSVSRILSFVRNGYFIMKEGNIDIQK